MHSIHPFEQEEVMAYLDGEISAGRATDIALHLRQCAECRELAASLRAVTGQLAAWQVEPSPTRLTEQIAAAEAQQLQTKPFTNEMTPLQRFFRALRALGTRPWTWVSAGVLTLILFVVVGRSNLLTARKAAFPASRDGDWPAIQQRVE